MSIVPNTGFQTISNTMQGGNYALCNVETGITYTWSTCNSTNNAFDTKLTLLSANGCSSSNLIAYNDNYSGCGNKSKIIWTATFTGVVKILLSENLIFYSPCTSTTKVLLLEWEATTQNCFHPTLLCNGENSQSGIVNSYYLKPHASTNWDSYNSTDNINNQIWYYFKIVQSGTIKIDIISPNYYDIDGIIWGAFTDLTNPCIATTSIPKVFSNDINSSFQLTLNTNASDVGKYYLLMISTSNVTKNSTAIISFTNTISGKIALCAPILSYNQPLCEGYNLQLNASPAISGATYNWTGPSGFTSTLQNPVINNVTSLNSGVYICNYLTTYGISTSSTISITVHPKPITSDIYHY